MLSREDTPVYEPIVIAQSVVIWRAYDGVVRSKLYALLAHWVSTRVTVASTSRSTLWGERGCNKFVPVLGGDGTKIAAPGDLFDQPPDETN